MRKMLFRGKRVDNGEWVCSGNLIHFNEDNEYYIPVVNSKCTCTHNENDNIIEWNEVMFCKVVPETVGQYTGLKDKNGKKIFEGDYWVDTDENDVFVVEFRDGQFCFVTYGVRGALMEYGWDEIAGGFGECDCEPMTDYIIENIEINGNIHDNPELLKGGADNGHP